VSAPTADAVGLEAEAPTYPRRRGRPSLKSAQTSAAPDPQAHPHSAAPSTAPIVGQAPGEGRALAITGSPAGELRSLTDLSAGERREMVAHFYMGKTIKALATMFNTDRATVKAIVGS
jgi:hypothetical protein